MRRAVFLDRDGIINRIVLRDGKPCSPRSVSEFEVLDGVSNALASLRRAGFLNIVITNQPDISRGLMDVQELESMHNCLRETLPVDDILVCPHDDRDGCPCRKPKPGMLLAAAKKWGVDLGSSFVIGDQWKDVAAGRGAGCTTILVDYPHNRDTQADYRAGSLAEAVEYILGNGARR